MNKFFLVVSALLIPISLVAAFVWYFSISLDPGIPSTARVSTLESEVLLDWYPYGSKIAFTTSDLDAYRAVGFSHAIRYPWMMALLRQASIGELGSWFDADLSTIDSLSHVLDISGLSKQALSGVSPRSRAVLQAYADGVNSAFEEGQVYRHESFLSIDTTPAEWEAWHSLAIEKMISWIAASESVAWPSSSFGLVDAPSLKTTTTIKSTNYNLLVSSRKLSDFLQLGGFANSMAWGVRNRDSTIVGFRFNSGSSQVPLLVPNLIVGGDNKSVQTVAILGTPFNLFSKAETSGYAVLPIGNASVEIVEIDSSQIELSFDRIRRFDGREELVTRTKMGDNHILQCQTNEQSIDPDEARPPLTCYIVVWDGFGSVTDADTWTTNPSDGEYLLWGSDPIIFSNDGSIGLPTASWMPSAFGNRIMVQGSSSWTPFLRSRLLALTTRPTWKSSDISIDTKSTWAESISGLLISALESEDTTSSNVATALTYLRNWDHSYSRASIAASIVEEWASIITVDSLLAISNKAFGSSKSVDPSVVETGIDLEIVQASRQALENLRIAYGADMSEWRWESVNSQHLKAPAWTALSQDSLGSGKTYQHIIGRNSPSVAPPGGHPSTLSWNASTVSGATPFPAALYITIKSNEFELSDFETIMPSGFVTTSGQSVQLTSERVHINSHTAPTNKTVLKPEN